MFDRLDPRSRFATMMHFAPPPRGPSISQILLGVGLVVLGVGIGTQLVPVLRRWSSQRSLPNSTSAPRREIDRWANEGGAVAPPAFPKSP